jgi:hypothetical protein
MSKGTAMNKQIEQFALKCGAWNQVYGNRNFMIDEHFDIAKFVELIVGECAVIADTERPNSLGCGYITKTKGALIKERFSIE